MEYRQLLNQEKRPCKLIAYKGADDQKKELRLRLIIVQKSLQAIQRYQRAQAFTYA